MRGHGEKPDGETVEGEPPDLDFGDTLYTEDGRAVGTVRGIDDSGAFVTFRTGAEGLSVEHARSGHAFGSAELVWRCMNCGEMGPIDGDLPSACPSCDARREELMYWTED